MDACYESRVSLSSLLSFPLPVLSARELALNLLFFLFLFMQTKLFLSSEAPLMEIFADDDPDRAEIADGARGGSSFQPFLLSFSSSLFSFVRHLTSFLSVLVFPQCWTIWESRLARTKSRRPCSAERRRSSLSRGVGAVSRRWEERDGRAFRQLVRTRRRIDELACSTSDIL